MRTRNMREQKALVQLHKCSGNTQIITNTREENQVQAAEAPKIQRKKKGNY